jgi:signal transduction histidine kinase
MAVMLYTAWEQRHVDVLSIQQKLGHLAKLEAREERQILTASRQILQALATFLELRGGDQVACSSFFGRLLERYHRYANFGAVKPDGEVFCSAVALSGPINASDRIWFQRTLASREFSFGDYQIGRITKRPVLVLSYPALDAHGEILAVVFAALKLGWLNRLELYEEADLPPGTTLTKLDAEGVVLAHQPATGNWSGYPFPVAELKEAVLKQKRGVMEASDPDGVSSVYAFEPLVSGWENREVYLILGVPKKVAFANSNRILLRNAAGMGGIAIVALMAAWFGADRVIMKPIKAMVKTTGTLAAGDLSTRTGLIDLGGELGSLARSFDDMAEKLQARQRERERAEKEIKSSRERLRNLSAHLESVREEERTRMAREIHDELGQALTALKMDVSWLDKRLPEEMTANKEKLKSMMKLMDRTIKTVQRLSGELRPGILDDLGLAAAVEWQAEDFQYRTGIACQVTVDCKEVSLNREQSTTIFRIFQETLTNIIRHAQATEVTVSLVAKHGNIVLEVGDNGRGITKEQINHPRSLGLIGIRERVHFLRGEVTITGHPGEGTKVVVSVPVMEKEEKESSHDKSTGGGRSPRGA